MKAILLALVVILSSCSGEKKQPCCSEETCVKDSDCLCWCSQICNWRKKTSSDNPTYIADDPNGKHCYCKQWDYDHYEDNCILHKGVEEPEGSL